MFLPNSMLLQPMKVGSEEGFKRLGMHLMYRICLILTQVTSNLTRKVPLTLSLNPTDHNLKKQAGSSNDKQAMYGVQAVCQY